MEIELNKQTYRVGRLDTKAQFHVSRRLLPILASMGISVAQLRKGLTLDAADMMVSLGPISQVMSSMSDEQTEYVLGSLLSVVQRRELGEGGKKQWAPVAANGGMDMMYEDINMPIMLRLAWASIKENLQDFLKGLPEDEPSGSS